MEKVVGFSRVFDFFCWINVECEGLYIVYFFVCLLRGIFSSYLGVLKGKFGFLV